MRTFASSLRRLGAHLAAILPHNHGHLSQPSAHSRCYAHQAGGDQHDVPTLELELLPEYRELDERRRFACADTIVMPALNAALFEEAREALAHNVMRGGYDVTWMDRDEAIRTVGIRYVEVAA